MMTHCRAQIAVLIGKCVIEWTVDLRSILTDQSPFAGNPIVVLAYAEGDLNRQCDDGCIRISDKEVAMNEMVGSQIDIEAAKALVEWKAMFGDRVVEIAKQLVARSSEPGYVTLSQYRQAAVIATRLLSDAITPVLED